MAKLSKEIENKEIGEDLCLLAELLFSEGLCIDTSALNNAGNVCSKIPENNQWKYSLGKLDFSIDEVGSTIPPTATELVLRFSISIGGSENGVNEITDPLNSLTFDLEISGSFYDDEVNDVLDLYCSWHLDRHIFQAGDGKNKFSHPLYHFTFGGNKMEGSGLDFGSTLILPSPRLAYPPMDAILGVDFILQNYFHKDKTNKLMENPKYLEMVKKSQTRLWQPYFDSIAAKWGNAGNVKYNVDFTYNRILPFLGLS
jgi:hypothetical protein